MSLSSDQHVPVVAVRLAEGRSGSTLLMQLLATGEGVVFDDRYPSEYRFLSYFARVAEMATEPFDEQIHPGVTPFFFDENRPWGPVPFVSDFIDVAELRSPALSGLWAAWSAVARQRQPGIVAYAEKVAVEIITLDRRRGRIVVSRRKVLAVERVRRLLQVGLLFFKAAHDFGQLFRCLVLQVLLWADQQLFFQCGELPFDFTL